ncbi:acid phosphatase [Paenibacillus sp. D9]|uniref:divergent PAP2 family protein n=1 Tax=Paenibacillus sp. D9 TaxID=665792 RepID=UPI00061F0182|nr:divergent PAP2 family protein [Paenibacillus sp. D9]KKC48114.1 acid phosphatase [Paenibacillus sp. D9]
MAYFLIPLVAWLIAGIMKFMINYIRFGSEAKSRIGNGGFPSNHTTIVTATTMTIGFHEGFQSPGFGLGIAVIAIVIIDATGLRRHVGYHAESLNKLQDKKIHRESMGHTKMEVAGGLGLGVLIGFLADLIVRSGWL